MEPIIKLDPAGKAPVLSYNVPEPTSYSGKFLVQLQFAKAAFKPECLKVPTTLATVLADTDLDDLTKAGKVTGKLKDKIGGIKPSLFSGGNMMNSMFAKQGGGIVGAGLVATAAKERMGDYLKDGKKLVFYKSMGGATRTRVIDKPQVADPSIYLVFSVGISNFLGNYGAGRTINTFTMLPGEKTSISIKTYKKSSSSRSEASSILDSYTEDKANDFEEAVQNENSNTETKDTSFNYYADAEGSGNIGVVKASAKAGVSGSVNSGMEEMSKNVASAMKKESAKASAKREVEINTTSEVSEEKGEETSIVRTLENINVSSTLNFVFRQMNQEFITIQHMTDIRIGYFNGFDESKMEVPLYNLDSLLSSVFVDPVAARATVMKALTGLKDYKGQKHADLLVKTIDEGVETYSFNLDKTSLFKDGASGTEVTVEGIILDVNKFVMRTDGVMVEAILGHGEALDDYSKNLQEEKIREKKFQNQLLELEVLERQKRLEILSSGDKNKAEIYEKLFPAEAPAATSTIAG